jgi:hypothetical protein
MPSWCRAQLKHRDDFYSIQTGSGDHPASYTMGTEGSYLRSEWLGHEADHSPPSTAKVKNEWSCTSNPQLHFHGVVLGNHRDNFTFTFLSLK